MFNAPQCRNPNKNYKILNVEYIIKENFHNVETTLHIHNHILQATFDVKSNDPISDVSFVLYFVSMQCYILKMGAKVCQ